MKKPTETDLRAGARRAAGFTLIEMMVVILLIAVLSGMTFRMVSVMGRNNDISRTRATLEKVGHALEEFRAIYGKYPDVKFYPIFVDADGDGIWNNLVGIRQPVAYEYPNALTGFEEDGASDEAAALARAEYVVRNESGGAYRYGTAGKHGIFYTFGLVSYLIPRFNGTSGADAAGARLGGRYEKNGKPRQSSEQAVSQWKTSNDKPDGESVGDPQRDLAAVRRILPHIGSYLTEENKAARTSQFLVAFHSNSNDVPIRSVSGELKLVVNNYATIRDAWWEGGNNGWRHELRYRSLPPYDSYDLWSAGPDGRTTGDLCDNRAHWTDAAEREGTHYKVKIGGQNVWFIGNGAPETDDDIHLGVD